LLSFLGIAIPNFVMALVIMYVASVGSAPRRRLIREYIGEAWSWAKVNQARAQLDPRVVIGTSDCRDDPAAPRKPPRRCRSSTW
jgi:peptide/nickel transport system permease protein